MFTQKSSVSVLLFVVASFFILAACNGQQKQSKVQLPTKAAQAIAKAVPGGKIIKVKEEEDDGKQVFEVQVQAGQKAYELDVSADGRILDKEENSGKEEEETVFNFDSDAVGSLPEGWSNQKTGKGGLGKWKVLADSTAPSKPNVLAQTSKENPGYHFNVAVAEQTDFSDVEIELKFKAIDGQEDQGGGPVWRYKDVDNYYVCRANPLESNFRVYKVVNGNRKQMQSAKVDIPSDVWHSLKVRNVGNHIQCWYDGKMYLDVTDDTFTSGKVGLWTKADAVTWFDNVKIEKEE
ncbi:MAG: DUF1080 domain-containing protein [Calditrichaeota bacterium]|nr:DUF1080 domain-containing protein [Calditrichota bacterium]